jgi:hypothetical protein
MSPKGGPPEVLAAVVAAMQAAGATEEMVAAAVGVCGESPKPQPNRGGRPRKYRTRAACDLAYRERLRLREKTCEETSEREKTCEETSKDTSQNEETCEETHALSLEEVKAIHETRHETTDDVTLRRQLLHAGQGNVDLGADIEPIRALLDQGCDLEADILPIIAREVPELPRPLKKWGAPWLVRDILAGREQRLNRFACHRGNHRCGGPGEWGVGEFPTEPRRSPAQACRRRLALSRISSPPEEAPRNFRGAPRNPCEHPRPLPGGGQGDPRNPPRNHGRCDAQEAAPPRRATQRA